MTGSKMRNWAIAVTAAVAVTGLFWDPLEARRNQQEDALTVESRLTTLETPVKGMQEDIREIKSDVKSIRTELAEVLGLLRGRGIAP